MNAQIFFSIELRATSFSSHPRCHAGIAVVIKLVR